MQRLSMDLMSVSLMLPVRAEELKWTFAQNKCPPSKVDFCQVLLK